MWHFDDTGPDHSRFSGPLKLSKAMQLPRSPGLYLVTCGDCLAHIGTSKRIADRVRQLANLGTHRGSSEVLCAAFCTKQWPLVWWEEHRTDQEARRREREFKGHYGEPPNPERFTTSCKDGRALREALLSHESNDSWNAGYVEAVFEIGEKLTLLFRERFDSMWMKTEKPPGPW